MSDVVGSSKAQERKVMRPCQMKQAEGMIVSSLYELSSDDSWVICSLELSNGATVNGRSEFIMGPTGQFNVGCRRAYQRAFQKVLDIGANHDNQCETQSRWQA